MDLLLKLATKAYAYNVHIPESSSANANYQAPLTSRVTGKESEIYNIVSFLNEYLWFFIIGAAFFAVLYAGFKIIFSSGEQSNTIKDIAINIGVGFLVAIMSFAVISIVVNLI